MSWTVDKPLRIGDLAIVAIVDMKVQVEAAGPAIVGSAQKNPLLILQLHKGLVTGFDVNGRSYDAEEIELLYPGTIRQAESLIDA